MELSFWIDLMKKKNLSWMFNSLFYQSYPFNNEKTPSVRQKKLRIKKDYLIRYSEHFIRSFSVFFKRACLEMASPLSAHMDCKAETKASGGSDRGPNRPRRIAWPMHTDWEIAPWIHSRWFFEFAGAFLISSSLKLYFLLQ